LHKPEDDRDEEECQENKKIAVNLDEPQSSDYNFYEVCKHLIPNI